MAEWNVNIEFDAPRCVSWTVSTRYPQNIEIKYTSQWNLTSKIFVDFMVNKLFSPQMFRLQDNSIDGHDINLKQT
jgi:hypothetical protein